MNSEIGQERGEEVEREEKRVEDRVEDRVVDLEEHQPTLEFQQQLLREVSMQ